MPNVPLGIYEDTIYIISGLDIFVIKKAQLLFKNILYQLAFLVSSYAQCPFGHMKIPFMSIAKKWL
jgi:hypothetical protein